MTLKRLLRATALPLLLFLFSLPSFAQNKTVSGKITDSRDGAPIVGASVTIKGGKTGTTSGADGSFSLPVPADVTVLQVSFIGYETQDVNIAGKMSVEVSLVSTSAGLNEVVVVGYGTARRRDLTGAVASIKEKDFNKGVMTSPDQLIQGKAAGVLVLSNTGQPGGSNTVRIRGNSSIRSGNQPLFVVDGVPLPGTSARPGTAGAGDYSNDGGNPLNFINPSDIANIEILKDASATAIYGSRGANGVVLITTKRGLTGAPYLDVNASTGVSSTLKKLEVLNADEYRKAMKDYNLTSGDYGGNSDAWDAITRKGITQNYNVAYGGGNANARYRLSTGFLDQQGILKNSELQKLTANFSSNVKFLESKKLGIDFNVIVTQTKEDIPAVSNYVGFTGNLISQALQWNPTLPLTKADGSINPFPVGNTTINPLSTLAYYKDKATVNTVIASVAPYYKITNDLEYKILYSVNRQNGIRKGMVNRLLNLENIEGHGIAFIGNNEQTNSQLTQTLNYTKQVSSSLHLNAVVGYEYLNFTNRNNFQVAKDFTNVGLDYYDYMQYAPQTSTEIGSYYNPTTELQSYFARAILNYKDKYLFTGTFRSDGSTRFGENKKYGYYPSLSVAWNVTNEEFMKGVSFVDNLKLRLGWGKTGNQEFPSGASKDRLVVTDNGVFSQVNFGNPDLKWETSTTTNAGVDFSLFSGRVYGSVDYFYKKTTDVLFERTLAQPAPSGKIWVNLDGYVLNSGVEIAVTGALINRENLSWNLTGNISFLHNTVQGLQGYYETGFLRGQGFSNVLGQRMVNGQPLNVWYLGIFEGIDKATGQSIYKNGDPSAYKYYVGSPNPKTLLGLSTDITYKKFSAIVNMNGNFGQYIFNNTAATVLGIGNLIGTRNIAKSVLNTNAKEALTNAPAPSTRNLEKGNYLKMANLTLSYHIGNVGNSIKNMSISLTGQNLFVITNYTGFDPEVNTDGTNEGIPSLGIEYIPYPSARTFMLGLRFSL